MSRQRSAAEVRAIHAKQQRTTSKVSGAEAAGHREGKYTLYARTVRLNGGATQRIYFFARDKPKSGSPAPLPPHLEAKTLPNGLPVLKRKNKPEGDLPPGMYATNGRVIDLRATTGGELRRMAAVGSDAGQGRKDEANAARSELQRRGTA